MKNFIGKKFSKPNYQNEDLNNKLTSIFESINNIEFEGLNSTLNELNFNNNNLEKNYINEEEKIKNEQQNDDFLLKLKIFDSLKKYYLKRKGKKPYLIKKQKLKEMADSFYSNLLKSRTFYGFYRILKRKSYFNMIKENYIDYRINFLSKFLIHGLVYSYNRLKLIKSFHLNKEKKIKKKLLSELKNKLSYQKTYDQYLLNQINKNPFAIYFMLIICNKGINNIKIKNKFNINYQNLRSAKIFHEKKRLFKLFCSLVYYSNNDFYNRNNYFQNTKDKIIKFFFLKKLKEKLMLRYRKKLFIGKLFIKKINILLSKKLKKEEIKSKLLGIQFKNKSNKNIENIIYEKNLSKKIFNLLKLNLQEKNRKILQFKEKIIIKDIHSFYKKSIVKTIKCLIVEGIRQKVNNYRRLYVLQLLFKISISKFKYTKCLNIRNKYLKKFGIDFIKNNVVQSKKKKKNTIKFYFNLFLLKYVYKITYRQRKKDYIKNNIMKLIIFHIKNKINEKKKINYKISLLQKNNLLNDIKKIYKCLKKSNKYDNVKKYDRKQIKIFGKRFINKLLKKHKLEKLKIKFINQNFKKIFQTFIKNINYKIIINSLKIVSHQYLIRNVYFKFIDEINKTFHKQIKYKRLREISNKFNAKKLLEILFISNKIKNLSNSVYELYKTKLKRKSFYELKKRYLDKIKYSMLSCRFNEYLIFSSLKKMSIEYSKRHKK